MFGLFNRPHSIIYRPQMDSSPSKISEAPSLARLARYLIIKAVADLVLVCILVVAFFYTAFNLNFRGEVESSAGHEINGWVVDQSAPDARVEVQLYVDGHFIENRQADSPRRDLMESSISRDERHGFSFNAPPLPTGEHEAIVYAVNSGGGVERRVLQMIGKPVRLKIE